jgi:hypothetical protein
MSLAKHPRPINAPRAPNGGKKNHPLLQSRRQDCNVLHFRPQSLPFVLNLKYRLLNIRNCS